MQTQQHSSLLLAMEGPNSAHLMVPVPDSAYVPAQPKLLRVYLPTNATSLVQITNDMSFKAILEMIAEKKQLVVDNHSIYLKTEAMAVEIAVAPSCLFGDYNVKEIRIGDKILTLDPGSEEGRRQASTSRRRGSVLNAPRMETQSVIDFPKTLTVTSSDSTVAMRDRSNSKRFQRPISSIQTLFGMGLKKSDEAIRSSGALPKVTGEDASSNNSSESTSPTRSPLPPRKQRDFVELTTGTPQDSNTTIDSASDVTKKDGLITEAFAALSTDVASTNVQFVRKRIDSASSPSATKFGTLKRNQIRGRSLSEQGTSVKDLMNPNTEGGEFLLIRVHVESEVTTVKLPVLCFIEDLLKYVVEKFSLIADEYTVKFKDGGDAEMDRTIQYYQQTAKFSEVTIVKGTKTYSTHIVQEDGKDVMVLQAGKNGPIVMASTAEKLIERATDDVEKSMEYVDTLLLTFRSYMKPAALFDELISRFNAELPPDPSKEDIEFYESHKGVTQMKTVLVLQWWVEHHWHDFSQSASLKKDCCDFIDILDTCGVQFHENVVALKRTVASQSLLDEEKMDMRAMTETRRKTMESMFDGIETATMADQICLHDFELFKDVHPIEYLNQIWRKKDDTEFPTPNLDYFSTRFDKETYWCATEILSHHEFKKRVAVLRKFIQLAKDLQERGNFFSMFSIYVGLNVNAVQRLKKTWESIGPKLKATYDEVEKMCDPSKNMKNYRELLYVQSPPILPFLPIYMKDLTFMNDGNPSLFHGLINFDKLRMMAKRVRDITNLYATPYKFDKIPAIQNYLQKPHVETNLLKLKAESLICEPAST